jgi:hypothetical protein
VVCDFLELAVFPLLAKNFWRYDISGFRGFSHSSFSLLLLMWVGDLDFR